MDLKISQTPHFTSWNLEDRGYFLGHIVGKELLIDLIQVLCRLSPFLSP